MHYCIRDDSVNKLLHRYHIIPAITWWGKICSVQSLRTPIKMSFWPNLCVGGEVQVLGILQYTCGLNLASALTLNQNLHFDRGSKADQGMAMMMAYDLLYFI